MEGEEQLVTVGERLRAAREAAGLSIEDVATQTRIPTRHLQSIETSDFARLPAPTYTIGFAKNYAAAVGLDRSEIGEQLRGELGGTRAASTTAEVFEPADPARAMPRWLIFGAIAAIVVAALIFSWLNRRSLEEPDEVAATETLAGDEQAAPAAPAQAQGPVVITANEAAWIQVYERGGAILFQGELAAGQSYEVPANAVAPLLRTGRPEAIRIAVGTADAPAIGTPGTSVSDVSLKPADLLRGPPAAAAPAPAAGTMPSAPAQATPRRAEPAPAEPRPAPAPTTPETDSPPPPPPQP